MTHRHTRHLPAREQTLSKRKQKNEIKFSVGVVNVSYVQYAVLFYNLSKLTGLAVCVLGPSLGCATVYGVVINALSYVELTENACRLPRTSTPFSPHS